MRQSCISEDLALRLLVKCRWGLRDLFAAERITIDVFVIPFRNPLQILSDLLKKLFVLSDV